MYAVKKNNSGCRAIEPEWEIEDDEYKSNSVDGLVIVINNVNRITRAQGKKHLLAKGNYAEIKAIIDSDQSNDGMRIGFYDEDFWLINDEFVIAAAAILGWSAEKLQHEFNEAAKL